MDRGDFLYQCFGVILDLIVAIIEDFGLLSSLPLTIRLRLLNGILTNLNSSFKQLGLNTRCLIQRTMFLSRLKVYFLLLDDLCGMLSGHGLVLRRLKLLTHSHKSRLSWPMIHSSRSWQILFLKCILSFLKEDHGTGNAKIGLFLIWIDGDVEITGVIDIWGTHQLFICCHPLFIGRYFSPVLLK